MTARPGAFEIRGKNRKPIRLKIAVSRLGSQTIASLTQKAKSKPFADGLYTLTTHGSSPRDALGREIDGNGDGVAGGDRVQRFRVVRGRLRAV